MKFEKMFDLANNMSAEEPENITLSAGGKDKEFTPKQQTRIFRKAIQAFIHKVATGTKEKAIQAFSGSTDVTKLTKDVFNVTGATPNYDLGWQRVFRGIRLMKGQLNWEIADVAEYSEFELTPEGAKCKIGSASGSSIIVGIKKYSKGIGFTWEMMEGRQLYRFIEQLLGLRDKLYLLWANIHYGLLGVAAATNPISWQAGTNNIDRDIATINLAAATITSATKDKGYGDTAQAQLVMYVSPLLRDRMDAALKATRQELVMGGAKQSAPVSWLVDVVYTYNSNIPVNKFVMVLPGNKIQNAVYMQELGLTETSIETLSKINTYWTAFGAIVADNDQCAEGALV